MTQYRCKICNRWLEAHDTQNYSNCLQELARQCNDLDYLMRHRHWLSPKEMEDSDDRADRLLEGDDA